MWMLLLDGCARTDEPDENERDSACVLGCPDTGEETIDTGDDTADTGETDTGDDSGIDWVPTGAGIAWFGDGAEDNSVLVIQLARVSEPAPGTRYHAWLSREGADPVLAGEVPVDGDTVDFSGDVGFDALAAGYDTLEVWSSADSAAPSGILAWTGRVPVATLAVLSELLLASSATPTGEGSLRAMETEIETIVAYTQDVIDGSAGVATLKSEAEVIANTIEEDEKGDPDPDYDGDGEVEAMDGLLPLHSEDGDPALTTLIQADFIDAATALTAIDPTSPILDYIDDAYDGLDVIAFWAHEAHVAARTATVSAAADAIELKLAEVIDDLGHALDGADDDGDGTVDLLTEGGLERSIYWIQYMAQFPVGVP